MELNPTCLSPRAPWDPSLPHQRYLVAPRSTISTLRDLSSILPAARVLVLGISWRNDEQPRETFEMFFFLLLPLCLAHPSRRLALHPRRHPRGLRTSGQSHLTEHWEQLTKRTLRPCRLDRPASASSIARTLQDAVIVTHADGGVLVPTNTCTMAHATLRLSPSLSVSHSLTLSRARAHTYTQPHNPNHQFGIRRRTPPEWSGASWTAMDPSMGNHPMSN